MVDTAALPLAAPLRVLVVDDQAAVREGLARLIAAAPCGPRDVHTAATPNEALRLLHQERAQVVVLDVDLGGVDGLSLLPALLPCARVLVLTSHGDAATRARALSLGADAFVEKTAPAAALLGELARLAPSSRGGQTSHGAMTKHPGVPGTSSLSRDGSAS